jgi:hypothetical protein
MCAPHRRKADASRTRSELRWAGSGLVQLAAGGLEARRIADAALAIWGAIDAALSPILGQRGIAALYQRSLHLVRAEHSWLAAAHDAESMPQSMGALHRSLSRQSGPNAAAATGALLQAFHDLVTNLIGLSLAERLLRPVWGSRSKCQGALE